MLKRDAEQSKARMQDYLLRFRAIFEEAREEGDLFAAAYASAKTAAFYCAGLTRCHEAADEYIKSFRKGIVQSCTAVLEVKKHD